MCAKQSLIGASKAVNLKAFADFGKGMFFLVSTAGVSVLFYLVVAKWQPLWTEGFRDFGNISTAIMHLGSTARPVAEMAPLILAEMDAMRQSMLNMERSMENIEEINPNVTDMTYTVNRRTWLIDRRIGMMNNQMDRVGDKLSPPGMMLPFNW